MHRRAAFVRTLVAIAGAAAFAACGDSPKSDTDTTTAQDDVWTAPPRKACTTAADCADQDACTWDERCEADGFCAFRTLSCDDQNECTSDTCDSAVGCLFENFAGVCDDGNPCTFGDACKDGACFPTEVAACDDQNPCTSDACDPATGDCVFEPESDLQNSGCDDGDACTTAGRCDEGRCVYEPVACPSDTQCKAWSCAPAEGCVATMIPGVCNDGDVCTTDDRCDGGECHGTGALACSDGDVCTDDRCDPKSGCYFPNNTAPCDDGIACTANDRCQDGACTSGSAACADDNACTTDICDGANGCKHFAAVGVCDDGNPCTTGDHCEDSVCLPGAASTCDDGKACTVDFCTPNGEVAICQNTRDDNCLDNLVQGDYYGLFRFGFDATTADPDEFDCLGTAVASLVRPTSGPDVISGSASCTWDLSLAANKSVIASWSARDTGERGFLDLGAVTVTVRVFKGTYTAHGALVATVPADLYLTTDLDAPTIFMFADGTATAPPANQPKPLLTTINLELSDIEVPLCCRPDGTCFPGSRDLCESVGADPVAPEASGPCCLNLPQGETCVDTPAAWCAQTANAVYLGPKPSACCLASGCALLSEDDCSASGGTYAGGLGCDDGDDDGFADVCPAPLGCAQPGVAVCSLAGKILTVSPTGFRPIPLRAEGNWTPGGANKWTTNLPFWVSIDGVEVPIPVLPPGQITVSCDGEVAVTGAFDIPDLSLAGFDVSAPETESPTFTLGFGLGQDLDELGAPLSDCRTYIFFYGNSRFTIGSGDDQSVLNDGSQVVVAIDPFDPAFYARAEGQILDGPTGGLASRVGFGISRGGYLKWVSEFPVPPAPGRPPEGATIYGHVYATGDMGIIPIPGSPVQIEVDGESVYDLGPFPEAAEAILAGILGGDLASIQDALNALGDGLSSGEVLDELAFGVNAHEIRLVVADEFTFVLGRGTLVAADSAVRFAAEVGNLETILPDEVPAELALALSKFGVKQVTSATGVVDASGFELRVVADLTLGPVLLDDAGLIIRYQDGHWSVDVEEPSISFDFLGWLESLKDFLGCDFTSESASCSVGGVPVGKFAFNTDGGRLHVEMEATLPGSMGKVEFETTVARNGDFVFTGHATIPIGARDFDATLVLTPDGVRAIGTLADISTSMTFDGTIYFDGSFVLTGLGSMTLLQFINMDASATVSYCPANSTCAKKGGVVGDFVMLVTGDVDAPVGTATLQGELIYKDGGGVSYDLQGMADFDVGGFAGLDGTMRVSNIGTPGAYLHLDLDVPLVAGTIDGELEADGSFLLSGTGSLKIPGFSNLASASITVSSAKGVEVASQLGVAGAQMKFSGRVGPDGFAFTGQNDISLLGFKVFGNVTFVGSATSASFSFAGGLFLGTTRVEVSGLVQSNGNFSFKGKTTIALFGYTLANADLTFDNSGVALAGDVNILNLATFRMQGRIESDLDFALSAGARTVTLPGGLSGELSASITKNGNNVRVAGQGYATFLGARANGGFSIDTSGHFDFYGSFGFDWSAGNLSLEGEVKLRVFNGGFSASAHGEACADFLFDDACAGVGGSIDSSGEVCIKFPIAGTQCIDIL